LTSSDQSLSNDNGPVLSASSDEMLEIPEESPTELKTPVKGGLKVQTRAGLSTASSAKSNQIKFEE